MDINVARHEDQPQNPEPKKRYNNTYVSKQNYTMRSIYNNYIYIF